MSTKPTSGPWNARGLTVFRGEETALSIAVATSHQPSARANARLIAAAPDLLEALQFVMSAHGEQLHDAFDMAQKAIAKATLT